MEDGDEEVFDEFELYETEQAPEGVSIWALFWNVLTLIRDICLAFGRFFGNLRADVASHSAKKQAEKNFASSVEAGIESLG